VVLLFDKFIDQPPTVRRRDFIQDVLDVFLVSLKLSDIGLKGHSVDMLLFGFDIFPASNVFGFLKSEQSKLGVIIGKGIL
jgi:hypothetical protein